MKLVRDRGDTAQAARRGSAAATRVLVIAPQPFFEWRGSPIRVSFLVRALAELGYQVDLLCMPVGAPFAFPGVSVHRPPNLFRVKAMAIGPSLPKAVYDVLLFVKALTLMARRRYAAIHGVEEAGILAVILGRLSGARVVFEKHSDPSSHRGGFLRNQVLRVYAAAERLTIRCADVVIATGPGLVHQAREAAPRKSIHHIFDIPSSIKPPEPEREKEVRSQWRSSPDELLAVYVGSFAVYQGIDLMFASMPKVFGACPQARFIVAGGEAEEIARRKAWLQGRGIEERVRFVGRIPPDDLPHHLAAADVLLCPRIAGRNSPLKLFDYFAAGRSIVAVDGPANRVLLDERSALLTEATPDAFAEGILRLLRDPGLRQALGDRGRQLFKTIYNYEGFKKRLALCYEQVLAPRGVGDVPQGIAALMRDLDGRIFAWDEGAEGLYGWPAGQALGSVSHQLLQTGFPVALDEINAKLEQAHLWEGELVHTTRDGRRIRVLSCWQRVAVSEGGYRIVEINRIVPPRKNGMAAAHFLFCTPAWSVAVDTVRAAFCCGTMR